MFGADVVLAVQLESPQGSKVSSQVDTCTSSFLPCCSSSVLLHVELKQGSVAFPPGATGLSHVLPWCELILCVTVEEVQGNQVLLEWTESFSGVL